MSFSPHLLASVCCRHQAELDEAKQKHHAELQRTQSEAQQQMHAELERKRQEAERLLNEQRSQYEDKLSELEKGLVSDIALH